MIPRRHSRSATTVLAGSPWQRRCTAGAVARQPTVHLLRLALLVGLSCAALLATSAGAARTPRAALPAIELFTRGGCPRCADARRLLERMQRQQPALRVIIAPVDRDPQARRRLQALSERAGVATPGIPSFTVGDALLVGYRDAPSAERALRALLAGHPGSVSGPTCGADADACDRRRPAASIRTSSVASASSAAGCCSSA